MYQPETRPYQVRVLSIGGARNDAYPWFSGSSLRLPELSKESDLLLGILDTVDLVVDGKYFLQVITDHDEENEREAILAKTEEA